MEYHKSAVKCVWNKKQMNTYFIKYTLKNTFKFKKCVYAKF